MWRDDLKKKYTNQYIPDKSTLRNFFDYYWAFETPEEVYSGLHMISIYIHTIELHCLIDRKYSLKMFKLYSSRKEKYKHESICPFKCRRDYITTRYD